MLSWTGSTRAHTHLHVGSWDGSVSVCCLGSSRKRTQNMYTHGPWLVEPYPRPESSLPLLKDARGSVTSSPYKALHNNVAELFFLLLLFFFLLCCAALSCILYCTESRLAHAVEQIRPASGVLALHRKSLPTVCELIQLPNFVITSLFCLKVFLLLLLLLTILASR